jgi:hypothetical protein
MLGTRLGRPVRLGILGTAICVLSACGGSSAASSGASAPVASTAPAPGGGGVSADPGAGGASANPGASVDTGDGPIGGDIGDRSKGSAQVQFSGGYTASVDLPFGAALAQFGLSGPQSAYLPYTDEADGTLFLTISNGQLVVQYAGPNQVGITNGGTPCELKIEALDDHQAKGSFTCKGMLLIQGEALGNADMSGAFDGRK